MAIPKVEFPFNVPVEVSLRFREGKLDQTGRFGDQMYYSLDDGRCMYLDLPVAEMVKELAPQRGQPFYIQKSGTGKKGEKPKWNVWQAEPAEPAATNPETPLEADLRRSLEQRQAPGSRPSAPVGAAAPPSRGPQQPPSNGNGNNGSYSNGNGAKNAPPPPPVAAPRIPPMKVPLDVALVHTVEMVQHAMAVTGEQWSDTSKQDMVSTLLITYQKEGWLAFPEWKGKK